ncbi:MAG: response regulator [Elusimicrobiales bacterium]|nr:response regulator [Elusimicrobiales bacterium]
MKRRTVLVIEDSVTWHGILRRWLERYEYTVHIAGTCTEGLLQAQLIKPDCILMDFHLPDGNAVSLCAEIRKASPTGTPPIIIFSGDPDAEGPAYQDCMADKFILKDMNALKTLSAEIAKEIERHRPQSLSD